MTTASPLYQSLARGLAAAAPAGSPARIPQASAALCSLTRTAGEHLLEQVMPFWEQRVMDPDYPGLLHHFDRQGNLTSSDKSTWCQGRMAYTFSLLLLELGQNGTHSASGRWRQAADAARRFVVDHAYAGKGRWHYLCTRDGQVKDDSGSAFSDVFALMGLCTWAMASGDKTDLPIIREAVATLAENVRNPAFSQYHHFKLDSAYLWHSPAMAAMGLVPLARMVLGDEAVAPLADWALDRILWTCANDDCEMLLELTDPAGRLVNTQAGRTTNPGHALESMWFCMEEAVYRQDQRLIDRVLQIIRWAFEKGWDKQHGGLFAFVDPDGNPPTDGVVSFNDRWDDKLWWVHAESMYTLALAAVLSDDPFYAQSYERLQTWTLNHLPDAEHGEWYLSVNRQGQPRQTLKGNVFRSAFHVPRALLKITRLGDCLAGWPQAHGAKTSNLGDAG